MSPQSQSFRPLPIHVDAAHNRRQRSLGFAFAALGAVLFSLKAIFIKFAYAANPELDSATLLAIRMGIALPLYALIAFWTVRRMGERRQFLTGKQVIISALIGLIGYYLAALFDFTGLQLITAQLERLILFTYPLWIMVLGALFFGKRITAKGVFAMFVAYCGIVVIFMRGSIAVGDNVVLGSLLIFGAALSFAVFQLLATKQIKLLGSAMFTCVAMISAGAGVLLHFTVQSALSGSFDRITSQPSEIWALGAAIAVISTLLPSFLINIALGRIGAQAVSVVGMISPLMTVVLAVTLLGEPFGLIDGVGTGLTVLGIGLFTWYERGAKDEK